MDSPKLYGELRNFVRTRLYREGGFENLVDMRRKQYADTLGREISYEYAEEEVICNSLGDIITSERVMNELAGKHRNLFGKIWHAVKEFFVKILRKMRGMDGDFAAKTPEQRIVERALLTKRRRLEDLFVKALKDASATSKASLALTDSEKFKNVTNPIEKAEKKTLTNTVDDNMKVSEGNRKYALADSTISKITAEMSETDRYEVLKDRIIQNVPNVTAIPPEILDKMPQISSWQDINKFLGKEKRKLIQKIAKEFGIFDKEYFNKDIEIAFEFSGNNFRESYNKQEKNYSDFAKMFSIFDSIVESAVGIEIHKRQDYKVDPTLENVYVLMSVYQDGDYFVPVKLEVKKFNDKQNTLYVAISLEKIKRTEVWKQGDTETGVTQNSRSVNISIAKIFEKINPSDKSFVKYIPDGFLNIDQKRAKEEALREDGMLKGALKGRYSLRDKLDREALSEAFYGMAESEAEREIVSKYRAEIDDIDDKIDERRRVIQRLEEIEGKSGFGGERARLEGKLKGLNAYITGRDTRLFELESAKPFRDMVERYETELGKKRQSRAKAMGDGQYMYVSRGRYNELMARDPTS